MNRVLNLLLVSLILAAPGLASVQNPSQQIETGTITGTVLDPNGAVIAEAEVRATNNRTGKPFLTKSNDEGLFALTGLPFGDYSLLISSPGFAKFYTQVALSREASSSAHNTTVSLAIGEFRIDAQLSVEVSATTLACVVCQYTYFSINYSDLPLIDRDPQRLVALQAGITEHNGRFSIAGRRAENKTALLDGFDNRDPATGRFTASLGLDSLSEFNSDYTNADTTVNSSYGQNSAPLLAAVSKAGTNKYHGQALWHLQRTGLGANSFFTNRGGLPRDQVMFDQAAFTLGGNISVPGFSGQDHAFFFISYEGTRDRETTGRQIIAPLESFVTRTAGVQGPLFRASLAQNRIQLASGSGLQDVDGDGLNDIGDATVRSSSSLARKLALARVDLRLTDTLQLNLRYFRDRSRGLDDFNDGAFTPASSLSATGKGDLAGLQFTALINPSTVNEFRFGYLKGLADLSGAGSGAPQLVAVNTPLSVGGGLPELPEQRENRAFIFADTFVRTVGAHTVSTGAQVVRRKQQYTSGGLEQGRIYYADALSLVTDGALSGGDPRYSIVRAELQQSPETERYQFTDLYVFANDNWRAGPRFVLNYGSAYNVYSGAFYERKTDRNNFAPFASFAFAPTHSESIILRGGVAILYVPPTRLAYGEIKATPLYPIATGFARSNEITGSPLPGDWASRDGAVEIEREYAGDFRTAYTESAFFFVQRSIGDRLILEAGYNSTFGHRLTRAYRTNRDSLHSSIDGSAGPSSNEETVLIASDGNSSYHAFQFRVTSRERRRLTFQAHYTLSKSIDTVSDETPSMFRSLALGPVAEGNAALERGPSDFDRRHRAVGFFIWRGPDFDRAGKHLRGVMGGWQLSGIITMQSGPRASLYSSGDFYGGRGDFNRDGVLNDRLAYFGGGSAQSSIRRRGSPADGYFDTSLFGVPGVDGREQLGRNTLLGPGFGSIDLSVQKRFQLSEAHRIEVRADVFNLANRVNFAPPVTDFVSANFGRSVEADRSRVLRLALKYSF